MKLVVKFIKDENTLFKFVSTKINSNEDMSEAFKDSHDAFSQKYPDISILTDDIIVGFDSE